MCIRDSNVSNPNGIQVYYRNNSSGYKWAHLTNGNQFNTNTVSQLNTWQHVALTRASGTTRLFINGVVIDTQTSDTSDVSSYDDITVAMGYGGRALTGYMSDFRIINGTALYTSTFTPPTAPLDTTPNGTKYLTCNDTANIFNTASGGSFSNGITTSVKIFGDVTSSTANLKYAGSNVLFPGSEDYIEVGFPELSNDDFTWEFWMYPTNVAGTNQSITDPRANNTNNPLIWIRSTNVIYYYRGADRIVGTTTLSSNTWYHVALVRTNGVAYLYLNGTLEGSSAETTSFTADVLRMGRRYTGTQFPYYGYIEDMRIARGLSRYPFIPAKETLTATADTVLLIGHDSALTNDGTAGGTATASGSAAVSNFGPVSSMKSIYFDGTGDYLTLASNSAYAIGSSDNFSIECWVYFNDFPTGHSPIMQWATNSLSESGTSGASFFGISSSSSGLGSISFNQHGSPNQLVPYANPNEHTFAEREWIHLHVQRIGSTAKSFINGQLAQTTTSSSSHIIDTRQPPSPPPVPWPPASPI